MDDIVPTGVTAVTSTAEGSALVPSSPNDRLPAPTATAPPPPGNSASREIARPAGGSVAYNLGAYSNLDEICMNMTLLNGQLGLFLDALAVLGRGSSALQDIIANVDELSRLYEAPVMTRSAADADSTVCATIDDMVRAAQDHGFAALQLNALGFDALAQMRNSQERMRAQGAGPRLLASAGRG